MITTTWQDDPLWFKDAIIYQVHVKAFFDRSGDGTGDFLGLAERLDYIESLGVNTIWLLPFYPSPMRDDGYDIADYRNVHPDFGTLADFKKFVREAHRRGLKVITELVINHTSDQHPWFQAARRAPEGSAKRAFYVWSKTKLKFPETRIIFTDTETSNWAWDDEAQAYYWHRFFSHQPDLNHNNPRVVDAVIRVMRFWLDIGVDGLRLDAIPYLCVREGTNNENLPETHEVIRRMRAVVDANYHGRMFLAEANQWPEDVREYFGEGDECHMAYHFPLMPRMYMAIAQEDRHPIVEIMRQTPPIPHNSQWAVFLRNHDELTLEMVTDRERDYMYETYAMDRRMRINLGIRRRLAPLMDNDPDKLKLMNSLLLSMPGSPILYYGDEIGMGDNIYLGDRNGVRTPMQWSPDRNGGFSTADPQKLYLPPIMDPVYGFQAVNVEAQTRDPSSLLNWTKRILDVRKAHRAFGRGSLEFLRPGNRKILAYVREYEGESVMCVANLARSAQPVELDLVRWKGHVPVEMMSRVPFPPIGEWPYLLTLHPHGVYWFLLAPSAEIPTWHTESPPPLELPVLVLFDGWRSFNAQPEGNRTERVRALREQFEQEVLPPWLPGQRWFQRGAPVTRARLARVGELPLGEGHWLAVWAETLRDNEPNYTYFLPLHLCWEKNVEEYRLHQGYALSKVRQHSQVGVISDAWLEERFCRALVYAMHNAERVPVPGGELRFHATGIYAGLVGPLPTPYELRRPMHESSNTAVVLSEKLFLKGYRRLQNGTSLELEIGRFLTEESPFDRIIPIAGWMEFASDEGEPTTLAVLQPYVENQGDAWSDTLDYLSRYLEHCQIDPSSDPSSLSAELHAASLARMHTLGVRTGELHRALSVTTTNPAFTPESVTADELREWGRRVRDEAEHTLELLADGVTALPEPARSLAEQLIASRAPLLAACERLPTRTSAFVKTRIHGDYHLGQVLVVENDFVIIDFEGEPSRPLAERRVKQSPLRDVAGMLRSFSYVAHVALGRVTADRPSDHPVLEPFARRWQGMAEEAFRFGYAEAVKDIPIGSADPDDTNRLLRLFELEKAVYEIRYELAHRPDWVTIPLRGLIALLT